MSPHSVFILLAVCNGFLAGAAIVATVLNIVCRGGSAAVSAELAVVNIGMTAFDAYMVWWGIA